MPTRKQRAVRKVYTDNFKRQIVELCQIGNKCKRDIAEEYDIPESALYEWIKNYKRYGTCNKTAIRQAKMTEVERLQKEVKQLKMENDILKAAALILNERGQQPSKS